MSGDTQPRKRKDKKRKKEEGIEHLATPIFTQPSKAELDDTNIHVHKEGGTGGGICAKIIFFILFSALIVLIGLIITENRGLTDLDTADRPSKFSEIFEGWIDDSPGHEEDDHLGHTAADDHDEEDEAEDHEEDIEHDEDEDHADEEEEHDEHNDEDEEEDEEVGKTSEENEDEENDENEYAPASEEEEEPEEDEDEAADEEDQDQDDATEDSIEAVQDDEEEDQADNDEEEGDLEDDDGNQGDGDEEADEGFQADDDDDDEHDETERSAEQEEDETEGGDDQDVKDEPDDGYESEEKVERVSKRSAEVKEKKPKKRSSAEVKEEGEQESSGMVVKVGVGMAILVVAYVVLIRKRRTELCEEQPDGQITPDLSRRNTIVVPPTLQEVEQDIEQDIDEDSDEEGETETEDEDDDPKPRPKSIKAKYQELRVTYTRSFTPDSEIDDIHKVGSKEEEEEDEHEDEGGEPDDEEEEEETDEEELESEEEEAEDDDEELLKRLEAKYGKLKGRQDHDADQPWKRVSTGSDDRSESDSDNASYPFTNITNKDDWKIKDEIDEAQKSVQNNPAYAIKLFDALLKTYPFSPRSLYGKAQALDCLADVQKSNHVLQQALGLYLKIVHNLENVPDALYLAVTDRAVNRLRFVGSYRAAIEVHKKLIERFSDAPKYRNDLAITYLTTGRVNEARDLLNETLQKWPNNGVALVHYGFILKTTDNDVEESVKYMQSGIDTKEPGVMDGRFYFHLGDGLARLGKKEEAMKVYEEGVEHGLFLSKYQRSLYNVNTLTGKPWWDKEDTPYQQLYALLEKYHKVIFKEGAALLNQKGYFEDEAENLRDTGDWKQFELYARGRKNVENCKKCPITCGIIDKVPDASGCRRGQTKFSVMHPGTHVWPHCGPTNCRLRVHLGLKVPPNTFIRVADQIKSWEEGKVFIFDDSFEHEVWHNGTDFRLVLIVDVWHPELTKAQKRGLPPI